MIIGKLEEKRRRETERKISASRLNSAKKRRATTPIRNTVKRA